jgi:hypothetical protein
LSVSAASASGFNGEPPYIWILEMKTDGGARRGLSRKGLLSAGSSRCVMPEPSYFAVNRTSESWQLIDRGYRERLVLSRSAQSCREAGRARLSRASSRPPWSKPARTRVGHWIEVINHPEIRHDCHHQSPNRDHQYRKPVHRGCPTLEVTIGTWWNHDQHISRGSPLGMQNLLQTTVLRPIAGEPSMSGAWIGWAMTRESPWA